MAAPDGSADAGGHFSLRSGQLLVSAEVRRAKADILKAIRTMLIFHSKFFKRNVIKGCYKDCV